MFSTITCWPKLSLSRGVKIRPMTSNAPPAANGTTIVTGRVGQSCAAADAVAATAGLDLLRTSMVQEPLSTPSRTVKPLNAEAQDSSPSRR
jgi:hypothetical protein